MYGSRIRYFRKKKRLSQQELGQIINKPQTTISDWENEKTLPDLNEAVQLAIALDIPITELTGEIKKTSS